MKPLYDYIFIKPLERTGIIQTDNDTTTCLAKVIDTGDNHYIDANGIDRIKKVEEGDIVLIHPSTVIKLETEKKGTFYIIKDLDILGVE